MLLSHQFTLALPVDQAWTVLTDVRRLAPCMPGAFLTSVDGNEFEGGLTVRVGPMTASYGGRARFTDLDDRQRRAVLVGEGREAKGRGGASLSLEVTLAPDGPAATRVQMETDLAISGRMAQFGQGVMADISSRMIAQFVNNLERELVRPAGTSGPGFPSGGSRGGPPAVNARPQQGRSSLPPEPVDVAAEDWPDDDRSEAAPDPTDGTTRGADRSDPTPDALDLASIIRPQLRRLRHPLTVITAFAAGLAIGRRWRTRTERA